MFSSMMILNIFVGFVFMCILQAGLEARSFKMGDKVPLYSSQIGPHFNPQETYPYTSYPFCKPKEAQKKLGQTLGQALHGIELTELALVKIGYRSNVASGSLCTKELSGKDYEKFKYAVDHQYWYQFYMDDLPVWAMVGGYGKDESERVPFVFAHKAFSIGYNVKNEIVEVNMTARNPTPIKPGAIIPFTYSVKWVKRNIPHELRFRRYLDHTFFEHQVHWFSIFNSFLLVIFLSAIVITILIRSLRRDLARETFDSDSDLIDETGWKSLGGDVFRSPSWLGLFSAVIGLGTQTIFLALCLITMAFIGNYYDSPGRLVQVAIAMHAFTSAIAGYKSGSFYSQNSGANWIRTMILTASLLPFLGLCVGCVLNTIALYYGSSQALPFLTILTLFVIFFGITLPSVFIGTIIGRSFAGKKPADAPRVYKLHTPIPPAPWYLSRFFIILGGGLLPFGSIFIETYFIFTSFWSYKYYYVYGFTFIVYCILIVVTMCTSIVVTYLLLNSGNHQWQWTAFMSTASTGFYVFLYSVYFFYYKTKMSGIMQTSYYFGYSAGGCLALSLLCGTLGYFGASLFVRKLYDNIKQE